MICQCQGGLVGGGGGCMLTRVGLFYGLFTPDVPFSILVVSIFLNPDDHDDWKRKVNGKGLEQCLSLEI